MRRRNLPDRDKWIADLRREIEQSGESLRSVARKSGVTPRVIMQVMSGYRDIKPSYESLAKIQRGLK